MNFLWTEGLDPPVFPSLNGDIHTDTLIIGGGMAGVLCAIRLKQAGADYTLVEGKTIGAGITQGTTAVITAQHDTLYQDMLKRFGVVKTRGYLNANLDAVADFRELARRIPCDFEDKPSIMYSAKNKELMSAEVSTLVSLGFNAQLTTNTPLPFLVAGAVCYPGMAQLHPLKLLYGAAKGLNIYQNTFVNKIDGTTATTKNGRIFAKKIIVATHFPFINRHGLYFAKLFQKRSYVIALENLPDLGCTLVDAAPQGVYLRNYKNLLLVGGGDHRTGGKTLGLAAPRSFAKQHFPNANEKYAWASQDCISLDGVPYIGPYSPGFPNIYVASGFNLWGMTTSMLAANILTDMVLHRKSPYASTFATSRNIFTSQLFSNMANTAWDFLAPTTKRCSHLGCGLKWNKEEHSWDCPCHGSRFNKEGRVLDNPAMRDINE